MFLTITIENSNDAHHYVCLSRRERLNHEDVIVHVITSNSYAIPRMFFLIVSAYIRL